MINHSNKFILITCNKILSNFSTNANNITRIKVITGKPNPTSSEIEQHFNDSLDFLSTNQLIVKTTAMDYAITDKGETFYRGGGFKV